MENPLPPEFADQYDVWKVLGTGGFGVVYQARHRSLRRDVALKVLHSEAFADPDQRQRFLAEARITAALRHPRIVEVFDFGTAPSCSWIAYEFLSGHTLRKFAQDGASPAELIAATVQVLEALDFAHQAGVIHRDVKPENVMADANVTADSPGGFKLVDFGIARWSSRSATRTRTGIVLGTPAYMAPEYILGSDPGPGSDIYAVGVMLFELLAGQLPFDSDSPTDVLDQHVRKVPPRLADRGISVDPRVEAALARALAKTPQLRFGRALEMAEALCPGKFPPPGSATLEVSSRAVRPPSRDGSGVTRRVNADSRPAATQVSTAPRPPAKLPLKWIVPMILIMIGAATAIFRTPRQIQRGGIGDKPPPASAATSPSPRPSMASSTSLQPRFKGPAGQRVLVEMHLWYDEMGTLWRLSRETAGEGVGGSTALLTHPDKAAKIEALRARSARQIERLAELFRKAKSLDAEGWLHLDACLEALVSELRREGIDRLADPGHFDRWRLLSGHARAIDDPEVRRMMLRSIELCYKLLIGDGNREGRRAAGECVAHADQMALLSYGESPAAIVARARWLCRALDNWGHGRDMDLLETGARRVERGLDPPPGLDGFLDLFGRSLDTHIVTGGQFNWIDACVRAMAWRLIDVVFRFRLTDAQWASSLELVRRLAIKSRAGDRSYFDLDHDAKLLVEKKSRVWDDLNAFATRTGRPRLEPAK